MGIRGSVKRGLDGHLIHTNVDTDVIVSEEPPLGSTEKPEELYDIIERFCAGRWMSFSRLHILLCVQCVTCYVCTGGAQQYGDAQGALHHYKAVLCRQVVSTFSSRCYVCYVPRHE